MNSNLRSLIRVGFGLVVFLIWLQLVGNPHVVETLTGLGVGIAGGWWVGRFLPTPPVEKATEPERDDPNVVATVNRELQP